MGKRRITGIFLAVVMIASLFSFGGMGVLADDYSPEAPARIPPLRMARERAAARQDGGVASIMPASDAVPLNVAIATPTGLARVSPATISVEQLRDDFLRVALTPPEFTQLPSGWEVIWTSDDLDIVWIGGWERGLEARVSINWRAQIGDQATITAQLRDNSWMHVGAPVEFTVTVTEFVPRITDYSYWCYINETLWWEESGGGFLYALRFDPEREERTRWMPAVGSINLSRLIPRPGRNPVTIAFRWAGMDAVAVPGSVGEFKSYAPVMTLTLEPRPELARNAVSYTPFAGGGLVMGTAPANAAAARTALNNFSYNHCWNFAMMSGRAGVNGWAYMCCWSSSSVANPFGGNFEIRQLSGGTGAAAWTAEMRGTTIYPASNSVRIRIPAIPRAPRAPRINTRGQTSTIAITDRMEFAVVTHDDIGGTTDAARDEFFAELWLCCCLDDEFAWRAGTGAMNLVGTGAILRCPEDGGALEAHDVILVRMAATARAPASFITAVALTAANLPAQTP